MGKRFDTIVFPGNKHKVFTLSYDDGVIQDRRLVELFNKYGVKCTFNLNFNHLGFKGYKKYHDTPVNVSKVEIDEISDLYKGHEIGGHSLNHPNLATIGTSQAMYEVIEDKIKLEKYTDYNLKMFAYPYGGFNLDVKEIIRLAGYKGARTTLSTHSFKLPDDTYELNPTCHHNDPELMNLAKDFIEYDNYRPIMFYVWGHGYEFDDRNNWEVIENLIKYISEYKDDIWFTTNGELLTYLQNYKRLEYSGDGSRIYNPTNTDIIIYAYDNTYVNLKANAMTLIDETGLL